MLEGVEQERKFRVASSRNPTIFRHPTLGGFELRHVYFLSLLELFGYRMQAASPDKADLIVCTIMQLPVGASDSDLEERIIQHLAAAAAMGRSHHFSRREGQRNRQSSHGRPHYMVFSTHPGAPSSDHVSSSMTRVGGENEPATVAVASRSTRIEFHGDEMPQETVQFPPAVTGQSSSVSRSTIISTNRRGMSFNNRYSLFSFVLALSLIFWCLQVINFYPFFPFFFKY